MVDYADVSFAFVRSGSSHLLCGVALWSYLATFHFRITLHGGVLWICFMVNRGYIHVTVWQHVMSLRGGPLWWPFGVALCSGASWCRFVVAHCSGPLQWATTSGAL